MKIISGSRDSLGVPMEPDEYIYDEYYDIYGDEIYYDSEYIETIDGNVLLDNFGKWLINKSNKLADGSYRLWDGYVTEEGCECYEYEGENFTEDEDWDLVAEHFLFRIERGESLYE